jgi:hypothetical protein
MRRLLLALPLILFFACDKQQPSGGGGGGVKNVSVDQVAEWVNAKSATVLDANNDDFRANNGVVPGAVLLANYLDWDPPTVLGPDKQRQLVFYCTNRL